MKNLKLALGLLLLHSFSAISGWDNPAVLCPEDVLPKGVACLDLSQVTNPFTDYPADITDEEKKRWSNQFPKDLNLCRSQEVLRREDLRPGSFTPLQIELSWMIVEGGKNVSQKLTSAMTAAQRFQMPPHVLLGALIQESLFAPMGIAEDGGNFSCGLAQLNIQEWCESVSTLALDERQRLGWPAVTCSQLNSKLLAPFYEIALTRLGHRPEYKLNSSDFLGIALPQVVSKWPEATSEIQNLRFKAVTSFIQSCQDIHLGITFKAQTLKNLFTRFVPAPLRNAETYSGGRSFPRSCQQSYSSKYYPLHTGWLMAVAMYNAGPQQPKLLEHYFQINPQNYPSFSPLDLIEALHWGGKFREGTKRVYFEDMSGKTYSQSWYKSCVVQRHLARVIQNVTQPGNVIARSLEQVACSQSVPQYRQISSGIKNPL